MSRDPTCVFHCDAQLVLALEAAFGPPVDSYVLGWQVWLQPAATGVELEYRLHPPADYRTPAGISHHDVWEAVVSQLADGVDRLRLGTEERELREVWTLLETYPAFGDALTPDEVRRLAEEALGRPADAAGSVDHDLLNGRWARRPGGFDLVAALLEQVGG